MDKLRTKSSILNKYWWTSIDKDIKEYIQGCGTCQQFNSRTSKPVWYLHPRPVPTEPFTAISIDHIGPLPETGNGNKFIVICVDHNYVFRTDASYEINGSSIHHWVHQGKGDKHIWLPVKNGLRPRLRFMSQHIEKFLSNTGIQHTTCCPYFHQANGLVERCVATIKNIIKKYCSDNHRKWDQHVGRITSFINSSKQGSTLFSPHFLLFGFEPCTENELGTSTVLPDISRLQSIKMLHEIRAEARDKLESALSSQKKCYDHGRRPSRFVIDDLVLIESNSTQLLILNTKTKYTRLILFILMTCALSNVSTTEKQRMFTSLKWNTSGSNQTGIPTFCSTIQALVKTLTLKETKIPQITLR